jgi:transposase
LADTCWTGDVPIDNTTSGIEFDLGHSVGATGLFVGSQLAGERAAVVMSLLQSAKLNGHKPCAYLKDVLTRLPTQLNSEIEQLQPNRWQLAG